MKKTNKALWLAILPLAFTACQDDNSLSNQNAQTGDLFTLHCTMGNNTPQTRAQIQTGNADASKEIFMWNNADQFTVYDHSLINDEALQDTPQTSTFTISGSYDESQPDNAAYFTTTTGLTEGHTITAIYPVQNVAVDKGNIQLAIPDFNNYTMPSTTAQAWKAYLSKCMLMATDATTVEGAGTNITFNQLCTMARITYTNATNETQKIETIQLKGDLEYFGNKMNFNIKTADFKVDYTSTFAQLAFTELSIEAGASTDIYLLFFPGQEFGDNGTLNISISNASQTLTTPVMSTSEISAKNGGAKKFEAGKRYWFRVIQTNAGLLWGKELPGDNVITNTALIKAIEENKSIEFVKDKNGYVDVIANETAIKNITDIDISNKNLSSLEGIEYFTNLLILNCSHNALTTIDISKNIKLMSLSCDYNSLTELNTEMNTNLYSLWCSANRLTALELSKNTSLKTVSCEMNRIASLDITALSELNKIICGSQHNIEETEGITLKLYLTNEQKEARWFSNSMGESGNLGIELITPALIVNKPLITAIEETAQVTFVKDANGYVSFSDNQKLIENITTIDVSNKGLTSLEGIEYFTNLKQLICYNNGLTNLDVSKNTQLTVLDCGNDYYNTDIAEKRPYYNRYTNLDISKNTQLIVFQCINAFLTELDVTKNTELDGLICTLNPLQTLDVSKNTKLRVLNCRSCSLSQLELSQNRELTNLECGDNNLTELDVTGLLELTHLNFVANQLTSINVTKNTKLIYLECSDNHINQLDVTNNTQLTHLSCYKNNLTSINISNNLLLERLSCFANSLGSLDLSKNTKLTVLDCGGNLFNELNLKSNTSITQLLCGSNNLTALDVSKNTLLTSLSCENNAIAELNVIQNAQLIHLSCAGNHFTTLDITRNTILEELYCAPGQGLSDRTLILTPKQKILWDNKWAAQNQSKHGTVTLQVQEP